MEWIFWFSVVWVFYAYFGYLICLAGLSLFKSRRHDQSIEPVKPFTVSFIITAFNEEKRIAQKIENSLEQDYSSEYLEIIIASDCSTDQTDAIVESYSDKGVRLVRAPERKGKENAQKHAVEAATGEILVFSDVATILEKDGITNIVSNFKNPAVGCVSSEDKFIDPDGKISGEGAYVRYEMFLRKLESRVNTLVGLSGSFFAARKSVCINWAPHLQSDFNTLLNTIKAGKKGISDPESLGFYHNIANEKKEFDRKVRTVLRGISVFMANLSLLNPLAYGLFSWQLFSHKLCRWLVPFALVAAVVTNILLVLSSWIYIVLLAIQAGFYGSALFYYKFIMTKEEAELAQFLEEKPFLKKGMALFRLPYFFLSVNMAIFLAWIKYFKGERTVLWTPSVR